MIKEVIFDIDNTLYSYDKGQGEGMRQMEAYILEHFQIGPEEFGSTYQRLQQECTRRLGRDNAVIHSRSIRIQNLLEEWNQPLYPHLKNLYQLYWDSLLAATEPEPGSVACVKRLREMGITVGIGTDMTAAMQYRKLETFGFLPYVNHMVTSQEAGAEKPARAFMELCIRKSKVRPEECLFVGDNFGKDICGSVRAGMNALWYNPGGKPLPGEAAELPEHYRVIRHFDEIIPSLSAFEASGEA